MIVLLAVPPMTRVVPVPATILVAAPAVGSVATDVTWPRVTCTLPP